MRPLPPGLAPPGGPSVRARAGRARAWARVRTERVFPLPPGPKHRGTRHLAAAGPQMSYRLRPQWRCWYRAGSRCDFSRGFAFRRGKALAFTRECFLEALNVAAADAGNGGAIVAA